MIGFVNLYKEKGLTSFFNIKKLSKVLNGCKVGHSGTLDPIAEGVLPVSLNEATKLASYVMAEDKEYVAGAILGFKTDSYDTTGNILGYGDKRIPQRDELERILDSFVGDVELEIPAYSAVNIDGKRAYELARQGLIENAGIRKSKIYSLELIDYSYPNFTFAVKVEKGTYIRSIINRLGELLGTFAVMDKLVRVKNGVFSIESSFTVDEINKMYKNGNYNFLIPVNKVLPWSRVIVKDQAVIMVRNGVSIKRYNYLYIPEDLTDIVFITDSKGVILAIAEKIEGDIPFRNIRVFKNDNFKI
jgi:tRNA pseudouridine55 synthase